MAKIMPAHVPVHIEPVLTPTPEVIGQSAKVEDVPPPAVDHYVDTYVARSVKSSPNGF